MGGVRRAPRTHVSHQGDCSGPRWALDSPSNAPHAAASSEHWINAVSLLVSSPCHLLASQRQAFGLKDSFFLPL